VYPVATPGDRERLAEVGALGLQRARVTLQLGVPGLRAGQALIERVQLEHGRA